MTPNPIIEYERIEVTLNNGVVVLGKDTKYGPTALTYSNRTQAVRRAEQEPGSHVARIGRPFYVVFPKEASP